LARRRRQGRLARVRRRAVDRRAPRGTPEGGRRMTKDNGPATVGAVAGTDSSSLVDDVVTLTPNNDPGPRPDQSDADVDRVLAEEAEAIRELGRSTINNVIEAGGRLTKVHAIVDHGRWLKFLKDECRWSVSTAYNHMRVYAMVQRDKFA